ncbi:MAG: ATP-dependent 6-phosphofructokinase [Candidatus Latescibacteria bacterium]|nr:ATP-dependent 6-phosphofructokinase [bacterium]MBD3424383.1 ATP-dependent 6-phosphofructokinase [Candidatus Latescibacterota bacterium]
MRIGVLTGGGDAPGLNPAIAGAVERASMYGYEVVGLKRGWEALVVDDPESYAVKLGPEVVRTYSRLGGSMLQCSRTNPVSEKNDRTEKVLKNARKLGLDALIAMGGDDTLGAGAELSARGLNVIGIPKTIDRDLAGTEYSLGYDTALNVICNSAEQIAHSAQSHQTMFFLEVMGRHAGWLALRGGEAAFADVILIPEYPFEIQQLVSVLTRKMEKSRELGFDHLYKIIVVAEGAHIIGEEEVRKDAKLDEFGHYSLGGVGNYLKGLLEHDFHHTRYMALAYLQRGAPPSQKDRQMGRRFGNNAVEMIKNGDTGVMVALRKSRLRKVPLKEIKKSPSLVDVEKHYDTENLNVKIEWTGQDQ